jgi:hypothetical protein
MSFSAGTFDVQCPECGRPITVLVEAEAVRRLGTGITILLGVNQQRMAEEIDQHVSEHH